MYSVDHHLTGTKGHNRRGPSEDIPLWLLKLKSPHFNGNLIEEI